LVFQDSYRQFNITQGLLQIGNKKDGYDDIEDIYELPYDGRGGA
jgi:hypothetical protein